MRRLKKIMCVALVLSAFALLLSSCVTTRKYEKQVLNYLEDKYEGDEFELLSYSKNKKTSSRYEIKAVCLTDETEFDIYAYSANNISDAYAVTKANNDMRVQLNKVLSYSEASKYVTDIRWLRLYNEETTDYSFLAADKVDAFEKQEQITSIDAIIFGNPLKAEQVADGVVATVKALESKDISLESIGFEFTVLTQECRMETSTADIESSTVEEITRFINEKLSESKDDQPVWMNYNRQVVFKYQSAAREVPDNFEK